MLDPERCWQVVCERDEAFDGRFVFAVRSTGIYCRPNCPARRPRRDNVSFHEDAASAEAAGFRPCKRCSPQGQSPAQQLDALIAAACELLRGEQRLTLPSLAARIGLSPSHLARAFKARTGMTPNAWAAAQRRQRLEAHLPEAESVLDAALAAGYSGTRALYEKPQALTPAQRRQRGAGEHLRYSIAPCPLGQVLLATSDRGVCALLFGDDPQGLREELQQRFAAARLEEDAESLRSWLQQVLAQLEEPRRAPTCRWTFAAAPSSNACGRRYRTFPAAKPAATPSWPDNCIATRAPWPAPVPATPSACCCPATAWWPAMAASAATAGDCSASANCWSRSSRRASRFSVRAAHPTLRCAQAAIGCAVRTSVPGVSIPASS